MARRLMMAGGTGDNCGGALHRGRAEGGEIRERE
jgi:hypothetical protein